MTNRRIAEPPMPESIIDNHLSLTKGAYTESLSIGPELVQILLAWSASLRTNSGLPQSSYLLTRKLKNLIRRQRHVEDHDLINKAVPGTACGF